ncbi:MAG: hypothetical protein JSR17_08170 [Proteobacteria bacterium]|nr:hypothetical protein [Pseudomonadota bacterium]
MRANAAYQPYAKSVNLASCISSIGLTCYGLLPLWRQSKEEDNNLGRYSLSTLYVMHIASVCVALAQVTGQVDLDASTVSALVGATAMLKSIGDYTYESTNNAKLIAEKSLVEEQLKKDNLEFKRCLILIEDLKDTEYDLALLKEELDFYKNYLENLESAQDISEIFNQLKNRAEQKQAKQQALLEFNKSGDTQALLDKINTLIQNKGNQAEIDKLGNQYQLWIKYSKIKASIEAMQKLLDDNPQLNKQTASYLKLILEQLKNKLNVKGKLPRRLSSILNVKFVQHHDKLDIKSRKWLSKYLKDNIVSLDGEINFLKETFHKKQEKFAQLSKFKPNEISNDISSLYETMKKLIDLQSQAELAAHTERSKEKSANFSLISSILAISICLIPNLQYTRRINQFKNGVGFIALIISNIDMIKKYILSMKLTAKEHKQLKLMLQDTSFNHIIQLRDSLVRNELLDTLSKVKGEIQREPQEKSSQPARSYNLRNSARFNVKGEFKKVFTKKTKEKFTAAKKSVNM